MRDLILQKSDLFFNGILVSLASFLSLLYFICTFIVSIKYTMGAR